MFLIDWWYSALASLGESKKKAAKGRRRRRRPTGKNETVSATWPLRDKTAT